MKWIGKLSEELDELIDKISIAWSQGKFLDRNSVEFEETLKSIGITEETFDELSRRLNLGSAAVSQYGENLLKYNEEIELSYDSIASSVISFVDTIGMAD